MDLIKLQTDPNLRREIAADEGIRSTPYKDICGIWTGGIGHNLEAHGASWAEISAWLSGGIPDALIQQWFTQDVEAAIVCCAQIFTEFEGLPDEPQRVLVNMAFDLMYELWEWHMLRAAVAAHNWQEASRSILRSKFAGQAPNRCRRLADRMRD
jgi:GH24 family phage-related lysozyme (muramidase)